jgi:predicted ATP-dependent Lon-type protease
MIFNTQGYLSIVLDTNVDLVGVSATDLAIKYKKPSGLTGTWSASVTQTTKLIYNFANADLDEIGLWQAQAFFKVSGKNAYCDITNFEVTQKLA